MELLDLANESQMSEFNEFARRHGEFMQSPSWGNVKRGRLCEGIISRGDDKSIRAVCLVLIKKTPLISLMYAPRGFIGEVSESTFNDIMEGTKILAKKYRSVAFMFDPRVSETDEPDFLKQYRSENIRPIQPRENVILDLSATYEETERGFKSDYRNRIHKALNRGVKLEIHNEEAVDEFYALYEETGKRNGFPVREKEYFKQMFSAFGNDCKIFLCRSEEGEPLSAAVGLCFGNRYTYVYGASSSQNRNLYPCYLMHSEMIKYAIAHNCKEYDFGGIPNYHDENSGGYRLWRFKHGFGGEAIEYVGEYSVVYNKFLVTLLKQSQKSPLIRLITLKLTKRKRS